MLRLYTAPQCHLLAIPARIHLVRLAAAAADPTCITDDRGHQQRGQATAEYALVLLAAATVALILLAWATKSGKIGDLFDAVFDSLIGKVT